MKIEKTEYSYHITECDLKFGEQITLDGELLIPASVLDKIRAEIMQLDYDIETIGFNLNAMSADEMVHTICREEVLQIIDKYKSESEE